MIRDRIYSSFFEMDFEKFISIKFIEKNDLVASFI